MATRRVNLSALAAKAEPDDQGPEEPLTPPPARIAEIEPAPERFEVPVGPKPEPTRLRRVPQKPEPGEWVRYDEYTRKEARLRADQYGQLSNISRHLNRARNGSGERITENTLIRVAIDLLLAGEDDLAGTTEAELRKSVGL